MRLRNIKNKQEILDQSSYLITNPEIYRGRWHELFQNDHPIFIEIGMGKGQFIIENAKRHPEINYIGIERYDTVLARALPKIDGSYPNLYIVRFNATFIDQIFDREIDRIYLNFSDPWPKKRHVSRRLMCTLFLKKYDAIFKNSKEIHMKTDNRELFEFALTSFSQYGYQLEEVHLDLYQSDIKENIATEYEEKFVKEHKPIYHCIVRKSEEILHKKL